MKHYSVVVGLLILLISGCSNVFDNDAMKFVKAVKNHDLAEVWQLISKDATDETLLKEEKEEKYQAFAKDYPNSLPYDVREVVELLKNDPSVTEVGKKEEDKKIKHAFTANYIGKGGYVYGNNKIAKKIKFTVSIDLEKKIIVEAAFGKVLEVNDSATKDSQKNVAVNLYKKYKESPSGNRNNIRKILVMYPDLETPIQELNDELKRVTKSISQKAFHEIISVEGKYGDSTPGNYVNRDFGYKTKIWTVDMKNKTNLPLVVGYKQDIEYMHLNWTSEERRDRLTNDNDSITLEPKETRGKYKTYGYQYYRDYKRYTYNDGTYKEEWDKYNPTFQYRSKNLKIISISIRK